MLSNIVLRENNKAFTTSLIIAKNCPTERINKITGIREEFERDHNKVLTLIRKYENYFLDHGKSTLKVDLNKQGSATEYYELNEDQATFLITLFTNTAKVVEFKSKLVKAFRKAIDEINRLYANPPRSEIIDAKRKAHHPMMDSLIEFRTELGKITQASHFMCENKLCNSIITGRFSAIDENKLSNQDAELLRQVRQMNDSLMKAGFDYDSRKKMLIKFGLKQKTKLIS